MPEIKRLIADINILREKLYKLIEQRGYDLSSVEVLEASDNLNTAIVNYNSLIRDNDKIKNM